MAEEAATREKGPDMTTLETLIDPVREAYRALWSRELTPATAADIAVAAEFVEATSGSRLPDELVAFWQLTDGCGMNGATLYGASESVRTTEIYADDYPDYFMVGQLEDAPLYAFDAESRRWVTLEQGDLDYGPRAVHSSFEDLAAMVFDLMLGNRWTHW